jgi:glutamate/tyrosine decarboxylase-like PLP-dependent enzyme
MAGALESDAHAVPELFPGIETRSRVGALLTAMLEEADLRVKAGPVRASQDFAAAAGQLTTFDFRSPRDLDDVLGWVVARMVDGIVHVNHPRYFGLFNPSPTFASQCADRIVASFNPQLATAVTSPFPVALEAHVIAAFARRAGLPDGAGGHFTSGGSEANLTALICALTWREPGFADRGARAFTGAPTVYVSAAAHLAWVKIVHETGIGRSALRLIETDASGRMCPVSLAARIADDVAHDCVPVMIVATAGTTGAGMIDPLRECGSIARNAGAWYHVDAAWGGAAICSDRLAPLMDGMGSADSITIDAHKWLATTMGCGMLLAARPGTLVDAFEAVMNCMPSRSASVDPYLNTMQWSRRFVGLRLFLGLATAGWEGYAKHVENACALADRLRRQLTADGWTCLNSSPLAVLCLRPPPGAPDARAIADAIVADGVAWISTVAFEGETAVRICITSGETTEADLDRLAEGLRRHAR